MYPFSHSCDEAPGTEKADARRGPEPGGEHRAAPPILHTHDRQIGLRCPTQAGGRTADYRRRLRASQPSASKPVPNSQGSGSSGTTGVGVAAAIVSANATVPPPASVADTWNVPAVPLVVQVVWAIPVAPVWTVILVPPFGNVQLGPLGGAVNVTLAPLIGPPGPSTAT